jgi:single-strand DNA-binding protein
MARGINKVILVGHLGADPEIKYMPSGGAVANVSIATTESWKDKTSGEKQERTEWHRVTFYQRLAEIVGEYLKKGAQIYVEGRLQTRKWQAKDGTDRYTTEIIASEMQMLGGKSGSGGAGGAASGGSRYDSAPANEDSGRAAAPAREDFDDDIPF